MLSSLEELEINLFQKSYDLKLCPQLKSELAPENNIPGNLHNTVKRNTGEYIYNPTIVFPWNMLLD